ncbi:MAG TPA: sensor domain-containing diguanylate cyclase [Rectinemataceae bacterium]|nr:sensor domain-containing diguanylate cyclase [Rectinemataceae bacterium]
MGDRGDWPKTENDDLVKLDFFTGIAASITGAKTLRETLQAVMDNIGHIFAPRNWSLFLRDPRSGDLAFTVVIGAKAQELRGKKVAAGSGIAGWIAERREDVIIEDVTKDRRFDPASDAQSGFRTKSIIGVPLVSRDRVFGVIELVNELDDRVFTRLELRILRTIADFAAIAIERSYYLEALRRLSMVDSLTGIANRRAFERILEREKERVKRSGKVFSILAIDVNGFKAINDSHGHHAGDEVLKRLARILEASTRHMDCAARVGGDEFVVLLPDTARPAAEEVRGRIVEATAEWSASAQYPFTISVGLETGDATTADSVLAGADRDMYLVKQARFEERAEDVEENLHDFLEDEVLDSKR